MSKKKAKPISKTDKEVKTEDEINVEEKPDTLKKIKEWESNGVPFIAFAMNSERFLLGFQNQFEVSGFVLDALWEDKKAPAYINLMESITNTKQLNNRQSEMLKMLSEDPDGQKLLQALRQ